MSLKYRNMLLYRKSILNYDYEESYSINEEEAFHLFFFCNFSYKIKKSYNRCRKTAQLCQMHCNLMFPCYTVSDMDGKVLMETLSHTISKYLVGMLEQNQECSEEKHLLLVSVICAPLHLLS